MMKISTVMTPVTLMLVLPLLTVLCADQQFLDEPESLTVREGEEVKNDFPKNIFPNSCNIFF